MSALVPAKSARQVPAALAADAEAARRFAEAARSDATLRAYRSDWSDFAAWCEGRGLTSMPVRPETVSLYIASYIASRAEARPVSDNGQPTAPLKVATLERRLAAISQAHKLAGVESPALRSKEPLHSVWAGVVRALGTAREKVAPALTADVVQMAEGCDEVVRLAEAFPEEASPGAALRGQRSGRGATRRSSSLASPRPSGGASWQRSAQSTSRSTRRGSGSSSLARRATRRARARSSAWSTGLGPRRAPSGQPGPISQPPAGRSPTRADPLPSRDPCSVPSTAGGVWVGKLSRGGP